MPRLFGNNFGSDYLYRVGCYGINSYRINNDSLVYRNFSLNGSLCFGRFAGSEQSYHGKRHENYYFFHFA